MADAMQLANVDASATLNLLDDDLQLVITDWTTQAAAEAEAAGIAELDDYELALPHEPVIEALTLVADVSGSSTKDNDDLRALVISLQEMRRKAMEWRNDPLRAESIWWHWNIDGEADKRALVHRSEITLAEGFLSMLRGQSIEIGLTIVRHPYYEPITTPSSATANSGSRSFGITATLAGVGDTPSRIPLTRVYSTTAGTGRAWLGIKPYGAGVSGFQPIWELEDAAGGTFGDDTTAGAVSGASGGDALTCTFSTEEDLVERVKIIYNDVSVSDATHNAGKFLVLLRYKAEGSGVGYHVRLNQAFNATSVVAPVSEVYIAGEASPIWRFAELGVITLPFGSGRDDAPSAATSIAYSGVSLDVARINGSGGDDFIMDCLVMIPMAHHLYIDEIYINITFDEGIAMTFENDENLALSVNDSPPSTINQPAPASFINWYVPPEGGLLVAAYEDSAAVVTNATAIVEWLPRWALFNGA